jgi:sortase family protein
MADRTGAGPHRRVLASVAVVLAVIGLLLVWAGTRPADLGAAPVVVADGPSTPSASPSAAGRPSASPRAPAGEPDVRERISELVLPESDPLAVSIPRIGVRSSLVDLGLDAEGVMEVPQDPALAGWFTRGAAPGALGPAVIAGHVTWDGAPSVFHRLGALRRGDEVTVRREDGRTAVFSVDRVSQFSKSRFPSRAVYGSIDHAGLRLITCGGTYDAARHRYLDNVVVFARLTSVRGGTG